MKPIVIHVATLLLALSLTACGGSERDELRDEIADNMVESSRGAIEQNDAHCFADALIDALGVEHARQYFQASTGDWDAMAASEPLTDDQQRMLAEGIMECGPGANMMQ